MDFFRLQCHAFDLLIFHSGRHLKAVPELAVDLHDKGDESIGSKCLIMFRPRLGMDTAAVRVATLPQLLSEVWGQWREQQQ